MKSTSKRLTVEVTCACPDAVVEAIKLIRGVVSVVEVDDQGEPVQVTVDSKASKNYLLGPDGERLGPWLTPREASMVLLFTAHKGNGGQSIRGAKRLRGMLAQTAPDLWRTASVDVVRATYATLCNKVMKWIPLTKGRGYYGVSKSA